MNAAFKTTSDRSHYVSHSAEPIMTEKGPPMLALMVIFAAAAALLAELGLHVLRSFEHGHNYEREMNGAFKRTSDVNL